MDSKTAKTIMDLLDSASEQLMDTTDTIKQTEDRSAVRNHIDTIAKICTLFSKIRYPIMEEYPELKKVLEPESDASAGYRAAMTNLIRESVATVQEPDVVCELPPTERIYAVAIEVNIVGASANLIS